jgi:hypothetical protein
VTSPEVVGGDDDPVADTADLDTRNNANTPGMWEDNFS